MMKEEDTTSAQVTTYGNYSKIILLTGVIFCSWLFINTLISKILAESRHSGSTFLELLGNMITSPSILFLVFIAALYFLPYLMVALIMKKAIFKNFFFYSSLLVFIAEILFVLFITYFPGSSTDSIAIVIIAPIALILILALSGTLKLVEHISK